jgi:type I restriction enzyme S subunit
MRSDPIDSTGEFNSLEIKQADVGLPDDSPYWLRKGDILVSRGNTIDLVGRAAVFEGNPSKCAMPDLLIRIRVQHDRIDPHFLSAFFHSEEAREYIESQVSGTSSTMPKISQPKLGAMPVPVPPLTVQQQIVGYLDGLQTKVETMKRLQLKTAAELDALLPSILDKAFNGDL